MSRAARRGFTLLELIVVVAILVALAGLIVTKLDIFQNKAEKASAAIQCRDMNRMIQVFRGTTNLYPDRWDSLVDRTGGTPVLKQPQLPGGLPGLDPGLVGGLPTGASTKLALLPAALTAGQARSLNRIGITTVLDHDGVLTPTTNYGNGFSLSNAIDGAADDVFATINAADSSGQRILNAIYPTLPIPPATTPVVTVPSDRILVVFGLGRYCTLVGSNLQSSNLTEAPVYPYESNQYYDRYLAVFEAYNSGGAARLVIVLGADGDVPGDEIANFNKN
ncbi:MAG: type II secretion system protein [Planctomycetota bacterium]